MNTNPATIITIFVILQWIGSSSAQSLTISPSGYNASEGAMDFTFTCTSTIEMINFITLEVEGVTLDIELEARGISISRTSSTTSTLTIEASLVNNNTTISCFALMGQVATFSEDIVFLVQGLLPPPDLLSFTHTPPSSSGVLSWSPPVSIDITDQDPDITGYRVCFNLTEEVTECVVTEETSYEFPNLHLPLEFSVAALNVVGEGNASTLFQQACVQDTGMYVHNDE